MNRRSFLLLTLTGVALSACRAVPLATTGAPSPSSGSAAPSASAQPYLSDRLLLRQIDGGLAAVNGTSGSRLFNLTAGMATADWSRWIALTPAGSRTGVRQFDLRDGSPLSEFTIDGNFEDAGVSSDGRLLLLVGRAAADGQPASHLVLLDLTTGQPRERATLSGSYSTDTVDATGQHVYLIQHQPEIKPSAYSVVHYDPSQHKVTGKVADKTGAEIMSGYKLRHAWSPSGEWLYSLYLNPGGNGAFVHALNVPSGWAACLDLPARGQPETLLQPYGLALSPQTQWVYAANPALGKLSAFRVGDLQVHSYDLPIGAISSAPAVSRTSEHDYNNVAVSPDGSAIYLGTGQGVLALQAGQLNQPGQLLMEGAAVGSIAASPNARLLYTLAQPASAKLTRIDLQTGSVGSMDIEAQNLAGIEAALAA